MYNLGQVPTGQFVKTESTWQNILGFLNKGVEFGFNVADKIKQIQTAQKARKLAEEQAKALAQMQVSIPAQPMPVPTYTGPNWRTIALIGGGIVLVALLLKR